MIADYQVNQSFRGLCASFILENSDIIRRLIAPEQLYLRITPKLHKI